mgnify:CR=1 FL=1
MDKLTDDKLKILLKVAQVQGTQSSSVGELFNYMQFLEIYKNRHAGPQL